MGVHGAEKRVVVERHSFGDLNMGGPGQRRRKESHGEMKGRRGGGETGQDGARAGGERT